MSIITDNTVLIHIYSGLESKNKMTKNSLGNVNSNDPDGNTMVNYLPV